MSDQADTQYQELEQLYHGKGKERQAIEAYRAFLSNNPQHAQAWMDLGALYYQSGDILEALQCFKTVTKLDPTMTAGWMQKAMLLSNLNCSQNPAFSQLQHLRNTYKQEYSSIKVLRKDLLACYENVLKLESGPDSPNYRAAQRNKAQVLEQLGKPKEALEICIQLLQDEKNECQRNYLQIAISRQYEAMKKWDHAIKAIDPLIEDGEFQLLLDKARVLKKARKKQEAEEASQSFFECVDEKYTQTRDVTYIFQKASGFEQMGDIQESIDCLDQLLNSGIKMSLRLTADAKDRIMRLKHNNS